MTTTTALQGFTAIQDCPKCGCVAVHWISEPRRASQDDWDYHEQLMADYDPFSDDVTRVSAWGGETVKMVHTNPPPSPPVDEDWPIARECRSCKFRWGNE